MGPYPRRLRNRVATAALGVIVMLLSAACTKPAGATKTGNGIVAAVGAENEYANVIGQLGGKYVEVTAIISNPNTDPHTFEASPSVAQAVSAAELIVQNGAGYDTFMNSIEAASPNPSRRILDVQSLLGLPGSIPNPHLWYRPTTMPVVAKAITNALSAIEPAHAAYFRANLAKFDRSLAPWVQALAHFKARFPGTPVATTEPVGDYMLQAAGTRNETPFAFQADVMNGVDPAPQDITLQNSLFTQHKVKVFLYNEQVTDALTESFVTLAKQHGVPIVALYETMPAGFDYQSWMLAEVQALQKAVADKISTNRL